LLDLPGFAEYRRYLAQGNKKFWKDLTDVRGKNVVRNANGDIHARRVGTCDRSHGKSKEMRFLSEEYLEALKSVGVEWHGKKLTELLEGYCMPPSGGSAVKESYIGQCERQKPGNWEKLINVDGFGYKVDEFLGHYPACPPPTADIFGRAIDRYLNTVDATKSAGWSARYRPGAKGAWSTSDEGRNLLAYFAGCRLALRFAEGANIAYLSAADLVQYGMKDPMEVFTKLEAHDAKKAASKRWRLIWISSIVDAVCQDIMHRDQNKSDIFAYASGEMDVQAVGIGHHDDGIARIGQAFDRLTAGGRRHMRGTDASGWDLSVSRDAIVFDAEARARRFTEVDPVAWKLLFAEAMCNSAHIVVLDGELWCSHFFGITASGIPSTSAQNSRIRSITLILCGAEAVISVGDDEVHAGDVDEELLATTGCITKAGSQTLSGPAGPISFTSHCYAKDDRGVWHARFENFIKMMAALDLRRVPGEPPATDVIQGMRFALRHTPEADAAFCSVVAAMGWYVAPAAPLPCEV
jgi:hypothetical protein